MPIEPDDKVEISYTITPLLFKRSVITMIVVGTLLNLINQTNGFLGIEPISWGKCILTYLVPLTVSLVSGVLTLKECREQHSKAKNG